jgi:cytidylate kinase
VLQDDPNHLSLFIHAPLEARIQRICETQNLKPEKAEQVITKTDKRRAAYYEYYSSKRWGVVDSYNFCLDSHYLGIDGTVQLIRTLVEQRENANSASI